MSERQHKLSHLCLRLLGPPPFCREHVVLLKTTMIELYALLQDLRSSPTLLGRPYAIPPARKTTSKPPQIKTRGLQPCNQHYPSADTFSTAIFTPPQLRRLSSAHSGTPSAQLQTRRIAPDWSKLASADLHPWASTTLQLDRIATAWDGSFAGPARIRSGWIDRGLTRGFLLLWRTKVTNLVSNKSKSEVERRAFCSCDSHACINILWGVSRSGAAGVCFLRRVSRFPGILGM